MRIELIKKFINTIVIIILAILITNCKNDSNHSHSNYLVNLKKIIFIDFQDIENESYYKTIYELEPKNDTFKLYQIERTFININNEEFKKYHLEPTKDKKFLRAIQKSEIINFLMAVNDTNYNTIRLKKFGYTESYLIINAEKIAKNLAFYKNLNKMEKEQLTIDIFDEIEVNKILPKCFDFWTIYDYPYCEIQLVYTKDTIKLFTTKQNPYMIPWEFENNRKSFNPAISTFFASIIPYKQFSNKFRLEGKDLLESLIADKIFFRISRPKISKEEFEYLYKDEHKLISKQFDLSVVTIGTVGSINWDGNCVWVKLHDKNQPDNLIFDVTLDYNQKPGSIKPFLKQKEYLLQGIYKANFLIEHIKQNPSKRELEIHFTKDKSFSVKAQGYFLENLPFKLKEDLKTDLDSTIFITLSNEKGYSRWIVFPNGNSILWHYSGEPPLDNYTDEQLLNLLSSKDSYKLFDSNGSLIIKK